MPKKRKKWATNVAKAIERKFVCPANCPIKYCGTEFDAEGNPLRTFDCSTTCTVRRKKI